MINQTQGAVTANTVTPGDGITRAWERTGGAVGLLTVVVLLGGSLAFGVSNTLTSASTPAAISEYLSSHGSSVLALTVVTVLGSAIGLWFIATLSRIVHERDARSSLGAIMLASGTAASAIAVFDGVTLTALVYLGKQGGPSDPALVRLFFDLQNGIFMPGLFGFFGAGLLAAAGLAMIRGRLARPWAGWLTLVLAACSVAGAVTGLTSVGGGTTLLGYIPVLSYVIFIVITSIFLLRGPHVPS